MQGWQCGLFNCFPIYYDTNCGLIIQFNVKLTNHKYPVKCLTLIPQNSTFAQ